MRPPVSRPLDPRSYTATPACAGISATPQRTQLYSMAHRAPSSVRVQCSSGNRCGVRTTPKRVGHGQYRHERGEERGNVRRLATLSFAENVGDRCRVLHEARTLPQERGNAGWLVVSREAQEAEAGRKAVEAGGHAPPPTSPPSAPSGRPVPSGRSSLPRRLVGAPSSRPPSTKRVTKRSGDRSYPLNHPTNHGHEPNAPACIRRSDSNHQLVNPSKQQPSRESRGVAVPARPHSQASSNR